MLRSLLHPVRRWRAGELWNSLDASRGWRAAAGMVIPLCLAETGRFPLDVIFAAIAAQNIAQIDVRGSYSLRFAFLASMGVLFILAAVMGALGAVNLPLALLFTVVLTLIAGWLRHASAEYGPPVGVPMTLIFLMSLAAPGSGGHLLNHAASILGGWMVGALLQMALWPVRPQHPLRAATSECWLAAADLIAALNDEAHADPAARATAVVQRETALRETLDRTLITLNTAGSSKMRPLVERLERLHLLAAQIITRTLALHTLLEDCAPAAAAAASGSPERRRAGTDIAASLLPMVRSLENIARTTALILVSRNPAHFAMFNVRLRRVLSLLAAARARTLANLPHFEPGEHLVEVLGQIECLLPVLQVALRETVDRAAERGAFSLELLDLHTWRLGSLPASINLSPRLDRVLVRYSVRMTLLMLLGVFVYKWFAIPHGYWLALTFIVVMQPDYGATRQRALERVLGTLLGSVLASALLFLHLPHPALIASVGVLTFLFAYFLKRRYGIAVVFVTVMVVLLTEIGGPVTLQLTLERIALTLVGGLITLGVAYALWPVWERDRFHPLLATALRETNNYLREICQRLRHGTGRDPALVAAKRRVETASSEVFGSLRRLNGEPNTPQEALQQAATLANGNLRLIRLLNLLMLHVAAQPARIDAPQLEEFEGHAQRALAALAMEEIAGPEREPALQEALRALEKHSISEMPGDPDGWVGRQLTYASTELAAMLTAALGENSLAAT